MIAYARLLFLTWFSTILVTSIRTPFDSLEESQYNLYQIAQEKNDRTSYQRHHQPDKIKEIDEKGKDEGVKPSLWNYVSESNSTKVISSDSNTRDVSRQDERELIVGGIFSPIYRYPYMVTIRYSSESSSTTLHSCGGTLIAPDVILTAAHCYNSQWGLPQVIVGDFDFDNPNDGGELFDTEVLAVHPEWDDLMLENDIMLFKLKGGKSSHAPVKLNVNDTVPSAAGEKVTVVGWGSTDPEGLIGANRLKEATLEYVPNHLCLERETIICAQDLDGVHDEDACKGDSGGPLILKGDNANEDVQVGLVSAGPFPCNIPDPGIYTRISKYFTWISTNVCASSSFPSLDFACEGLTFSPSISSIPTAQPSLSLAPSIKGLPFTLMIQLDSYPNELLWGIYQGNSSTATVSKFDGYPSSKENQKVYESFLLEPNQFFRFIISDRHGDGICCRHGKGHYALYYGTRTELDDRRMIFQGAGDFEKEIVHPFRSIAPTVTPSLPPTVSRAPTLSLIPSSMPSLSIAPTISDVPVTIVIRFDRYPSTIGWAVYEDDSKQNEQLDVSKAVPIASKFGYSNSYSFDFAYENVYLKSSSDYKFLIYDTNGNGICCNAGTGYYFLYYGEIDESTKDTMEERKNMMFHLGNFGSSIIHSFSTIKKPSYTQMPTSASIYNQFITFQIQFDEFPFEISYMVTSPDGQTIYAKKEPGSYTVSANRLIEHKVYLPHSTPFRVRVEDKFTDGILDNGYIQIFDGPVSDRIVLAKITGKFTNKVYIFELEYKSLPPSTTPSTSPTVSKSNSPSIKPSVSQTSGPTSGKISSSATIPSSPFSEPYETKETTSSSFLTMSNSVLIIVICTLCFLH